MHLHENNTLFLKLQVKLFEQFPHHALCHHEQNIYSQPFANYTNE